MAISSKELAALLGVSPSAVSLAINGRSGISDETRSRILQAANEYGLRRPSKKESVSHVIYLIIYKKHGMVYGDTDFFSALIEGISRSVALQGYNLQISYFYGNQDQKEQLSLLRSAQCEGIILLATEMLNEDILPFLRLPHPLVVLDSYFENRTVDSVVINNVQGAYLATRYLLQKGHRFIGHIASSIPINNFSERRDGFFKAAMEYPDCRTMEVSVASTQDGAYRDMFAYLDTEPKLPTAFFADNDIITVSCIRALKEHGYSIPNQVSIVGFDDMPVSYITSPKFSTIHVPKEALGMYAVDRLMNKIRGSDDCFVRISVNVSLVERDSVLDLNL